ncbi:MAG: tRNA uridine-5-carboxymethylaminomethyl(34) synthesis enzyme MnmG [Phycisphaerales bacterium JB059]
MSRFDVIIIGGGHAGAEAAWAAANLLPEQGRVALITTDPAKIGVMSCNPAIGGLAKGQLVREIDALGGLMGLVADATGIMFKVLNQSRGPAVRGPRCQSDKHAYARGVRTLIESRPEIEIIRGMVGRVLTETVPGSTRRRATGVELAPEEDARRTVTLSARAVVLTTGTFMRGLMHTGETRTPGGRVGEQAATSLSQDLEAMGFELGRLKTGTPPRLDRTTIDWEGLEPQHGDASPTPFSDLTPVGWGVGGLALERFPRIEQVACRQTRTSPEAHETIRANLHRAPMFSGQIESRGPRYCPSLEDKVVRFADRESHGVFLEPESLTCRSVYCNGISTSLPTDVQDVIVRTMPGCERAAILQYGYAVEYDSVRPHQIRATGETKLVEGLFLAGQINGTSGYEEAAAQGLVAGVNAARRARAEGDWTLGRDEAYIGVLMDDLVTRTPVEPYRMFTSRAEHRLLLRPDNAPDRLTPVAKRLGLLDSTELGRRRQEVFERRGAALGQLRASIDGATVGGEPLELALRRPSADVQTLRDALPGLRLDAGVARGVWETAFAERMYAPYVERQRTQIRRQRALESRRIPAWVADHRFEGLRAEASEALARFRPETFGQAGRLEGVTPADLNLLSVLVARGPAQASP